MLKPCLEYASADNLVQERGTVAMWVKREWPDVGYEPDGAAISDWVLPPPLRPIPGQPFNHDFPK